MDTLIIHDWLDSNYYDELKKEEGHGISEDEINTIILERLNSDRKIKQEETIKKSIVEGDEQYSEERNSIRKELIARRWAWEFLRRNHDYQREYEQISLLFPDDEEYKERVGNGDMEWLEKARNKKYARMENLASYYYSQPTANDFETYDEYKERCPGVLIKPYAQYLSEKYHIYPIPKNPKEEMGEHENIYFSNVDADLVYGHEIPSWEIGSPIKPEAFDRYANEKDYMVFAFAINSPLIKQVAMAKDIISERKSLTDTEDLNYRSPANDKSIKMDKFSVYIRVLDARSACVSETKMAYKIYPGEDRLNAGEKIDTNPGTSKIARNREAAIKLRDNDYWRLASKS